MGIEIVDEPMLGGTWVIPHGFGSLNDDLVCVSAERFDGRGDELAERHSRLSLLTARRELAGVRNIRLEGAP
jgi:hypothetical protein